MKRTAPEEDSAMAHPGLRGRRRGVVAVILTGRPPGLNDSLTSGQSAVICTD